MTLNLLFMSLEDMHEPRGRLLTGGRARSSKILTPPQGLEEDLNEYSTRPGLHHPSGARWRYPRLV